MNESVFKRKSINTYKSERRKVVTSDERINLSDNDNKEVNNGNDNKDNDNDDDNSDNDNNEIVIGSSKKTYANVRSYRNEIDDDKLEDYSTLRKKWGVDDSDEESYDKTHKSFSQLRSTGEHKRFEEEIEYICEGLNNPKSSKQTLLNILKNMLKNFNHYLKNFIEIEYTLESFWYSLVNCDNELNDLIYNKMLLIILFKFSTSTNLINIVHDFKPSFLEVIIKLYNFDFNESNTINYLTKIDKKYLNDMNILIKINFDLNQFEKEYFIDLIFENVMNSTTITNL